MEKNQLSIRFTEEKYATKAEVAKGLGFSLVDNIWDNICAYRSNFYNYLPIKSIDNVPLKFCACSSINEKILKLNMKVLRLYTEASKIEKDNQDFDIFKNQSFCDCLYYLCKYKGVDSSKEYLRTIIMKEVKTLPNDYKFIINYANSLNYVLNRFSNKIDIDFLAELYSQITDNNELTSFYRTSDDNSRENKVVVDRVYSYAPNKIIEPMMENLFNFINDDKYSFLLRAFAAYYYFSYVKPFPSLNEELGVLMFKAIIANECSGGLSTFIPFEKILVEKKEELNSVNFEVQKNNDLTYFVSFGINLLDECIKDSLDNVANFNVSILKNDFYKSETNQEIKKENEVENKNINENIPSFLVDSKKEENVLFKVTSNKNETSKPGFNESSKVETQVNEQNQMRETIAVSYIPPVLDENQAQRLEDHLLELDPTMRRGEAAFYARHCTLGKKYTIAQCKKYLSCAYETARKTMERLVELGYYRKEMVKNKFVYAPIQRK